MRWGGGGREKILKAKIGHKNFTFSLVQSVHIADALEPKKKQKQATNPKFSTQHTVTVIKLSVEQGQFLIREDFFHFLVYKKKTVFAAKTSLVLSLSRSISLSAA